MCGLYDYDSDCGVHSLDCEVPSALSQSFSHSVVESVQEEKLLVLGDGFFDSGDLGSGLSVSGVEGSCGGRLGHFGKHFEVVSRFDFAREVGYSVIGNSNSVVLRNGLCVSGASSSFSWLLKFDFHRKGRSLGGRCSFRGFSSCESRRSEDKEEDDDDIVVDYVDEEEEESKSDGASSESSYADPKEVERVYKVIEELFALDRNMEAVLDESGINLSHDLVVDVLLRFKHARKPAFRFFTWAGQRPGFAHDSRTYNVMMRILGKTRQFETMLSMLDEMGAKGLLTVDTFVIAIQAFAGAKERKKAVGIFELMKKHKFIIGVETINTLLDSLGRDKLGKEAQTLFEKLKSRFTPNLRTYTVLLNGWCRVKNLMEAGKIWNEMIDQGFKPDVVAHNTMLEGLLKAKKRSDATKLFKVMKEKGPVPNVRTYTMLINELCKQSKMDEAAECFEDMLNAGCEPDTAVYTCLMTGFGNQRRMDKVYGLLKEMKERGCVPDARMYSALIKLLTNRRMPDDAVNMYKKMIQDGIQPTIHIYNMMMKSFFVAGDHKMGREVWSEMVSKGCCPDDNSYIVLIGGLIRQGRSEEACKYLEEMMEKGMKVPQLDYNKFTADFSRAGRPNILEELAQKMKFSGKFEVSEVFARWAKMMKRRVKRRDPVY